MEKLKKAIAKVEKRLNYTKRAMADVSRIIEELQEKLYSKGINCLVSSKTEFFCKWGEETARGSWTEEIGAAYFQYKNGVLRVLKRHEELGYLGFEDPVISFLNIDFSNFVKALLEIIEKIMKLDSNNSLAKDARELLGKIVGV